MRTGDEPGHPAPAPVLEEASAVNAIAARTVNEAIRDGRRDDGVPANFICECGALGCHAVITLAPGEYEAVRADARQFVTAPGHEGPDDEPVASSDRYAVVAKRGAAAALAQRDGLRARRAPASYRVPSLNFAFPATPEAVPAARHWIAEFVDAHTDDGELRGRIVLAFSEAFTNAVIHGRPGQVHVAADVEHGSFEIVVSDHGPGLTQTQADGLGVGLSIIARSTDAFAIRERTEVWLSFAISASA